MPSSTARFSIATAALLVPRDLDFLVGIYAFGAMIAFLASPAASWVNGSHLIVDGGFTNRTHF